jgi:hypothetical protein
MQFLGEQLEGQGHNQAYLPPIGRISVFHSAIATFYSPSDSSGMGGMRRERIRATPEWRGGFGRYDTVFVSEDANAPGMQGLMVARVRLFFSFQAAGVLYPCALVHWFSRTAEVCHPETGMWTVERNLDNEGNPVLQVIHLDTILRACHLLPVFGNGRVPRGLHFTDTLDAFQAYYVNKFADHHANEISF